VSKGNPGSGSRARSCARRSGTPRAARPMRSV
jgi:hypothetical protein